MTALRVGSLALIALGVAVSGLPVPLRAAGGGLLFLLWLWLLRPGAERRALRLLPGHALLFFGVGRTGSLPGFALWASAVALTLGLACGGAGTRPLWAILWPVLLAAVHQVGAARLTGAAFWAWTAGLALAALALTLKEGRTILGKRGER
ncbi:MAG: hypothetical protein N2507_04705 [Candidatus Bipolaricaulota bacterium]|nr:hypothetical protein [Candidatus Bipolaricaulota bacterium]MCX7844616.1 hypothetical protein [Candidatus Bipolaricaulota bacterium]MDW8152117.1 hypothetical protein [Candidatus Bipolaricaulota bacterium]